MKASTITLKTEQDIEKLRISGRLAAQVLEMIGEYVKPGVSTEYLDDICHDFIVSYSPCFVKQNFQIMI